MGRLGKIIRFFPELVIILKGLIAAVRSLLFLILWHAFVTYIFGLVFCLQMNDTELGEQRFSSVRKSMHTLVVHGLFFDISELTYSIQEESGVLEAVFWIYIFLSFMSIVLVAGV